MMESSDNEVSDVSVKVSRGFGGGMSLTSTGKLRILAAVHAVMTDVSYAQKAGENAFHRYKYVTEADAISALRPAMLKHGLVLFPSVNQPPSMDVNGNTHVIVTYTLFHAPSGEYWIAQVPGSGNDRAKNGSIGDKGVYKALTGASKYMLLKTFLMETGDDPEVASPHDAGAPHGKDEQARLDWALSLSNGMMEFAQTATDPVAMNEYWRSCHADIERLRTEHHDLFETVLGAFKKRRLALERANQPLKVENQPREGT